MLTTISWQQYVVAIMIITALYYLYIAIRYYQKDIAHLFHRKKISIDAFVGLATADIAVMGPAKPDPGISLTDGRELLFSSSNSEVLDNQLPDMATPAETSENSEQTVLQEVEQLIEGFRESDDKSAFLALLKILLVSRGTDEPGVDRAATLNHVIKAAREKKLSFDISLADLEPIQV